MPRKQPLYATIAQLLGSIDNCEKNGNQEWRDRHQERLDQLCRNNLPSGSGHDRGSDLLEESTPDRLVFSADFHHMDSNGFYDGWTHHKVVIKPSLAFGFEVRVTGRDRNNIKDHIADTFHDILSREVEMVD